MYVKIPISMTILMKVRSMVLLKKTRIWTREEHGVVEEDEDLDEEDFEEDDFDLRGSSPKSSASSKRPPPSASRPRSYRRPPPTRGGPSFEDEYEDDDYYDEPRRNIPPSTRRPSSQRQLCLKQLNHPKRTSLKSHRYINYALKNIISYRTIST